MGLTMMETWASLYANADMNWTGLDYISILNSMTGFW